MSLRTARRALLLPMVALSFGLTACGDETTVASNPGETRCGLFLVDAPAQRQAHRLDASAVLALQPGDAEARLPADLPGPAFGIVLEVPMSAFEGCSTATDGSALVIEMSRSAEPPAEESPYLVYAATSEADSFEVLRVDGTDYRIVG